MKAATTQPNRNTTNLLIDSAIFIAFLVAMAPHFSGIAVHEWLGIAFGAAIITHLLLHWQWIIQITRRIFGKVSTSTRINYILNLLLFVDVTVIILTGLLISKSALPALGIQVALGGGWKMLHTTSSNLFVLLTGLHVALHWQWVVNVAKRLLARPSAPKLQVANEA